MNGQKVFVKALGQTHLEHFTLTCQNADLILVLGALPSRHRPSLAYEIEKSVQNGSKLVYLSTMEDAVLTPISTFFSRYEVGSEEGVLALLAKSFLLHAALPSDDRAYFEDLDEGYVSAESNIGEEEIEEIEALYAKATSVVLAIGDDLIRHACAENIARFAGLIANYGKAKLLLPTQRVEDLSMATESPLEAICELASFDGIIVYECPIQGMQEESQLIGSSQFQMAAKVQHNDLIQVVIGQTVYPRTFVRDDSLKGVIALLPGTKATEAYPYHVAKIVKAEQ